MIKRQKNNPAALVTGGAARIGQAICLKLAGMGYDIALHYHTSEKEARQTARRITRKGVRCALFSCDLSSEFEVSCLIKMVKTKSPRLNLLINNASTFEKDDLKSADMELFDRHMTVNLKAPFILSRNFAKICQKGQIINILDTRITQHTTNHLTYLLSKKSLADLTRLTARELAPRIRVNGISPGLILPPSKEKNQYLDRLAKHIPLKRKGGVKNITQSIEFLINNSFVTGQIIFNDGGEHLSYTTY